MTTRTFENPLNGYRESVGTSAFFWTLFFGILYLPTKGAWLPAAFLVLWALFWGVSLGPPGTLFVVPALVVVAFMSKDMIVKSYLRKGWKEVLPEP